MKLLRKILIRSGIWGYFYPPQNFMGTKVHRGWPWKKRITIEEIVSAQPMTTETNLVFEYTYTENEE